jgi:predicted RNase H-like HicB family nuclease
MSLIPFAPFTDFSQISKNHHNLNIRVNSCPFVVTISEAGRTEMSRYLIVIEETGTGYSAYSPDLPGCIATGTTRDSVGREMHDAIEFHLDGLRRAGEPIPSPRSEAAYCEVGA